MRSFEDLVEEARRAHTGLWDLSFLEGRVTQADPSWDYRALVGECARGARALLDMGTGDGRIPASLDPAPSLVVATEAYAPMVPVAARALRARGMHPVRVGEPASVALPFRDEAFDLVINRHESYRREEVLRILRPGGTFLTQQVGGRDFAELNVALDAGPHPYESFRLEGVTADLRTGGFEVVDAREELLQAAIHDVAAVVYLLRVAPWQVRGGFDLDGYLPRLRALHERGPWPLRVHSDRMLVRARKPG